MRVQCQCSTLLASILWAVSLAAFGQVSGSLSAAPAPTTSSAPAPIRLKSLSPDSAAPAGLMSAPGQTKNTADGQAKDTADQQPDVPRRVIERVPDQPNHFQRFVQQTTGRELPVYGHNLFSAPSGYSPISQAPVPNDYILGPGDEIHLQIWGGIDAEQRLVINRHGQINLPKVGVINLTGVRAGDLESVLRDKIGHVFTNFSLNATLGRLRSIQIYVVGQARQPGTYTVSSLSTLINALFEVGGPGSNGSMRNIQLKRNGRVVGKMDLYNFIAHGDRSGDVQLQPGDVIVVSPVGPRVAVLGAFGQPAVYELSGADNVGNVLALGGGVTALTEPRKALLERIDPGAATARHVEVFALDKAGLTHPLHDGDILTLFEISSQFANAVTLRGNVARPLRHPYVEGMRIRDLIPDREALITTDYYQRKNRLVQFEATQGGNTNVAQVRNLLDEVNWDYAVIERLDRNTLTIKLIPFNLGRAVIDGDELHNLVLQHGDIVTILSKKDLRVPQHRQTRLVRVEGEVAAPGFYQVGADETLPQLLARLGGVTTGAYLYGTEFTRESVRAQQQKNLDTVVRELESQAQSESGRLIANANAATDNNAQTQLALQQQQLQRQLARMKTLKSNGRISLELPSAKVVMVDLPTLPLEDGDAIYIPSRPSFVFVVGEVHNENALIYRPGRNVGDVLKIAGVSEAADPDNAFVLRADGSVKSARDNTGLFGMGGFGSIELMPGDAVVVPAKLDRQTGWTKFMIGLKDWTQILYQMGLGAAAWKTLGL